MDVNILRRGCVKFMSDFSNITTIGKSFPSKFHSGQISDASIQEKFLKRKTIGNCS